MLNCGEFARRGDTLIEGASGYPGIGEVAILSGDPGHYRMLSLLVGPPGYDAAWVEGNFSAGAASVVLGHPPPTAPDPIGQAWHAFGFPSCTEAVQE